MCVYFSTFNVRENAIKTHCFRINNVVFLQFSIVMNRSQKCIKYSQIEDTKELNEFRRLEKVNNKVVCGDILS